MIGLIDRYVAREVLQTLVGVLLVLLLIFLSNRLVRYLADAAAGELPGNVILMLVGLNAAKYLILLIPLGLYLAILLVLGRLYRDSEMAAMAACGVGGPRLYRAILILALPLALVQGWMALQLVPWADAEKERLIDAAQRDMEVNAIRAGSFQEGMEGKRVLYAQQVTEEPRMHQVFIHVRRDDGRSVTLTAKEGHLENKPGGRYLVLSEGYRYEGRPGDADFRIVEFQRHGVLLRRSEPPEEGGKLATRTTAELWGSNDPAAAAELQWRLSMPLGALVLALMALPIGRVNPRSGRYGRLFVAILLYVGYVNLLAFAQSWTEHGTIPVAVGLWWVHGLFLLLTAVLLVRQLGLRWVLRGPGRGSAA